jgi:RsiW-degrading membrane proteinase PrsW (M82 family)
MPIKVQCDCGKWLRMPDDAAGRRARCPACGRAFEVPPSSPEPMPVVSIGSNDPYEFAPDRDSAAKVAAERAAAQLRANQSVKHGAGNPLPSGIKPNQALPPLPPSRRVVVDPIVGKTNKPYLYLVLLLALIPLAWSTFHPGDKEDVKHRISQTVDDHPEILDQVKAAESMQQLCAAMPEDRVEGALLPYDTYLHWGFAGLSGGLFFGLVLLLFPSGHTRIWHLLIISIFTGTAGIVLLLGFQWLAFHVPFITPRGIIGLLIDIVALIGLSYSWAMSAHSGFALSLLGFTAGVGFCEESCKAIPLIWKARTDGFYSWRSAMIWGLISGVGFGVSEGITYSHDFYNGLQGGQIYLIRFISCVALHAIWSAAVGINIYRRQDHFRGQLHVLEWLLQILITVIVPMLLHGAYDTLLKEHYDWAALLVALVSFGWLAYQIEMAKRRLDSLAPGYVA